MKRKSFWRAINEQFNWENNVLLYACLRDYCWCWLQVWAVIHSFMALLPRPSLCYSPSTVTIRHVCRILHSFTCWAANVVFVCWLDLLAGCRQMFNNWLSVKRMSLDLYHLLITMAEITLNKAASNRGLRTWMWEVMHTISSQSTAQIYSFSINGSHIVVPGSEHHLETCRNEHLGLIRDLNHKLEVQPSTLILTHLSGDSGASSTLLPVCLALLAVYMATGKHDLFSNVRSKMRQCACHFSSTGK